MQTETAFTMRTAMGEIIREVIEAVADRPGDSPARRLTRQQTTASTVMSFGPGDPVETMLAGQCVIFDHLLRDGAHDTLRGQQPDIKLRARPQILATGKMFLAHLARFEQMQTRSAGRLTVQPPAEPAISSAAGASTPQDIAASVTADDARQAARVGPAEPVIGAAKAETPADATITDPSGADPTGAVRVEGQVGATRASTVVAPAEPPTRAPHDPVRQVTTPATQPAVGQSAVAQTAVAAPGGDPGIVHARPNMLPEQPKPGTRVPPPPQTHRAASELQGIQTPGVSRQDDAPARRTTSLAGSLSPGPGDQTLRDRQPVAAVRAELVEDPV